MGSFPQSVFMTMAKAELTIVTYNYGADHIDHIIKELSRGLSPYKDAVLTHWSPVIHICINKFTITGSYNGLSPGRRQAIIWISVGILLIGPLGTNFSEILIKIYKFSLKKMHLKMWSGKWWPHCFGLNVLTICNIQNSVKKVVSLPWIQMININLKKIFKKFLVLLQSCLLWTDKLAVILEQCNMRIPINGITNITSL